MHALSSKRGLIALALLSTSSVAHAPTLGLPYMDFATGLAHGQGPFMTPWSNLSFRQTVKELCFLPFAEFTR